MRNKSKGDDGVKRTTRGLVRWLTALMIAEQLGVSKSTVSRALNDDSSISVAVRRRVRRLADELGYRPNAAARRLGTRRSGIIGLIIGESQSLFYAEQFDWLLIQLAARNLRLLLFRIRDGGNVSDVIPVVLLCQVDACLLASVSVSVSSDADRVLADHELPAVLLNRASRWSHDGAVLCNNIEGGRTMGEHLVACGARRIAFIAGPEAASTSHDRETCVLAALEGGHPRAGMVGGYSPEGGAAARRAFLAAKKHPMQFLRQAISWRLAPSMRRERQSGCAW